MKKVMVIFVAVFFVWAWMGPNPLFSGTETKAEKSEIEKAIESGDHATLAKIYMDLAQKERAKAASHDTMIASLKKSHVHYKGMENDMTTHCSVLKGNALKSAEKYEEMAAAEETLAKKAGAPKK